MNKKTVTIDLNISGILSILLIMFIILKVTGVINWGWGLVLLPLWIELGLFWCWIYSNYHCCNYNSNTEVEVLNKIKNNSFCA